MNTKKHFFDIRRVPKSGGAALLVVIFFFISVSLAIVHSATIGAISELRTYRTLAASKFAYVAAEAGIEDVFYRTLNARNVPASVVIGLNKATSTISVTDVSATEKMIWATGNANDSQIRRLYMSTSKNTTNLGFFYGAQVGAGGITMSNNTRITGLNYPTNRGDIYSNGNITGNPNVVVTGNAVSASSIALDETASSSSFVTDTEVGRTNPYIDFAQSFVISTTTTSLSLYKVSLYIKRTTPTPAAGSANIRIVNDVAGSPGTTVLASVALNSALVATSYGWVDFIFASPPMLDPFTTYWIVFDSTQAARYWSWYRGSTDTYTGGSSQYRQVWNSGAAWAGLTGDFGFNVSLGSGISEIDNVDVLGLARANTIKNSDITGDAYYSTISGTSVGGVSYTPSPTPPQIPLPLSSTTIAQWQADAESGGVINGNCGTAGNAACNTFPLSIGPRRINGNFVIDGDVTVTGTLFVTGSITSSNGRTIRCAAGYGPSSCIVMASSTINVSNNSNIYGSGTAGSFLMLLSTIKGCVGPGSTGVCTGLNSAISLSNNVGGALFYATDSQVDISNNAIITAIIAYKIDLTNNAEIHYDPLVANVSFAPASSGGIGTWRVNRWNEY